MSDTASSAFQNLFFPKHNNPIKSKFVNSNHRLKPTDDKNYYFYYYYYFEGIHIQYTQQNLIKYFSNKQLLLETFKKVGSRRAEFMFLVFQRRSSIKRIFFEFTGEF